MTARTSVVIAVAAALVAGLAAPAVARAHDSLAPPGALHIWLPTEDWVANHWSPFDEQALKLALGLRGRDLEAHLYDDHHTLAELALRRGIDLGRLTDELIAPWRAHVDERRLAVLRDRALRVLTQGHLAQHVFFHVFHSSGALHAVAGLSGITPAQFIAQRARGLTPLEIARRRGVTAAALRNALVAFLRHHHDLGIELGEAAPAESAIVLGRQLRALSCWLRTVHPGHDRGNPYGKAKRQHGVHGSGWPSTSAQRRLDEAGVERVRRALLPSCWRRPPAWSWSAHGLAAP